MNHVYAVALRSAGPCLRPSLWETPLSTLSRSLHHLQQCRQSQTSFVGLSLRCDKAVLFRKPYTAIFRKHFSSSPLPAFRSTLSKNALGPLKRDAEVERGLAFGETALTENELPYIFGNVLPPLDSATRLLRILHGRRVDGTLDLPLPEDLQILLDDDPNVVDFALDWLRENYHVDEEDAVIARIEREETGYEGRTPSQLRQRAQDLGLYGPQTGKIDQERNTHPVTEEPPAPEPHAPDAPEYYGPQSGRYQAKLSEKGDVFGVSKIDQIREQNEAQAKQDEEDLEQQIEAIQAKRIAQAEEERSKSLATRPEQSIEAADEEVRPPNEFEKWVLRAKNRASSKLTMDSPEIRNRTLISRLLPSFSFLALFCVGCWLYTQYWQPPKRSERLWSNMSLSFATVAGIIAVNVGIFVLWRFPPAWGLLNRYFLVVPATPRPLSLFGNIFSHVQWKHLLFNMLPLIVFGPSLHEDLGRGNFLALYLASGVIGSFASLTHHAARGILYTSSLGASGSVWAVTAAFFSVHSENDFTIFFMPEEWKENASIKGWMLFSCLIAIDIFSGIRGKPVTVDYVAHAAGALTGWMLAEWYKWNKAQMQPNGQFVPRTKLPWWQVLLQEAENQED